VFLLGDGWWWCSLNRNIQRDRDKEGIVCFYSHEIRDYQVMGRRFSDDFSF